MCVCMCLKAMQVGALRTAELFPPLVLSYRLRMSVLKGKRSEHMLASPLLESKAVLNSHEPMVHAEQIEDRTSLPSAHRDGTKLKVRLGSILLRPGSCAALILTATFDLLRVVVRVLTQKLYSLNIEDATSRVAPLRCCSLVVLSQLQDSYRRNAAKSVEVWSNFAVPSIWIIWEVMEKLTKPMSSFTFPKTSGVHGTDCMNHGGYIAP